MYIPEEFYIKNKDAMIEFIRKNSFGILFSQVKGRPFATHLPLLLDPDQKKLFGHFAKANPHWRELDNTEVLIVFQGPHAYISPSWYVEKQAVPTWNYVAVHVSGHCQIVRDEKKLHSLLRDMVRFYEPDSPLLERFDEEFYVKLEKIVVGVEIAITAMEGKAKLSQNRSLETVRGVIEGLNNSKDDQAREVANLMQVLLDTMHKPD